LIREKIHIAARRPAGKWLCNATYGYDSCFSWTKNFAKNNVRLGFPRSVVPYTLTLVATRGAARLDCIPTQYVGTRINIPICRPSRFLKPGRSNRQHTEQVGQQHAPSCLMRKLPVPSGYVQDRYGTGLLFQGWRFLGRVGYNNERGAGNDKPRFREVILRLITGKTKQRTGAGRLKDNPVKRLIL